MNSRQKQVQMSLLKNEKAVIKQLEQSYQNAIADIDKWNEEHEYDDDYISIHEFKFVA